MLLPVCETRVTYLPPENSAAWAQEVADRTRKYSSPLVLLNKLMRYIIPAENSENTTELEKKSRAYNATNLTINGDKKIYRDTCKCNDHLATTHKAEETRHHPHKTRTSQINPILRLPTRVCKCVPTQPANVSSGTLHILVPIKPHTTAQTRP